MGKEQLAAVASQSRLRIACTWQAGNCKQKQRFLLLFLRADLKGKDSEFAKTDRKFGFSTHFYPLYLTVAIGFVTGYVSNNRIKSVRGLVAGIIGRSLL
jgi:hypothetical protein